MSRWVAKPSVVLIALLVAVLATTAVASRYRVGPGDVLNVSVHNEPEAGGPVTVSPKGLIQNNLLGNVEVNDLTVEEIQEVLTRKLSEYIRNPRVSVEVLEFNARKVYVFGGVNSTGPFPLRENTTLLEVLITDAGGPREGAAGTITILRGYLTAGVPLEDEGDEALPEGTRTANSTTGPYETIQIEMDKLFKPEDGIPVHIPLKDGDIINVPTPDSAVGEGERRVFVFGAVGSPGIYRMEGTNFTALNAILGAGGFTKFASRNRVRLIREIDGQKVERTIRVGDVMRGQKDKDVILQPEDTLVVPEGLF